MEPAPSLTPRERQVLDSIEAFIREHGYPPSVREIGARVGLRSSSTVHAYLRQLVRKGFLRQEASRPRALGLLAPPQEEAPGALRRIPLLRRPPEAGDPPPGESAPDPLGWLLLPPGLPGAEAAYALRVHGSAMEDAGIAEGDVVLCLPAAAAPAGELVVALVGDEPLVRRLLPDGESFRLEAANPGVQPLLGREARPVGRVVAVLHRAGGAAGGRPPQPR